MGELQISKSRLRILFILVFFLSCTCLQAGWEFYVLEGNTTPTPKSASTLLDFFAKEKYPISATAYNLFSTAGMPAQFQYHQYVRHASFDIGGVTIGCYDGSYGSEEFTCIAIRDNDHEWLNTVLKHYQFSCGGLYEGDESMAVAHLAGRLAAQGVKGEVIGAAVASFVQLVGSDSGRANLNIAKFAGGISTMEVKSGFFGSDDAFDIFAKVQPIWEAATGGSESYASTTYGSDSGTGTGTAPDSMSLLGTQPTAAGSSQYDNSADSYNVDNDAGYVPGETKKLDGPVDKALLSIIRYFSK